VASWAFTLKEKNKNTLNKKEKMNLMGRNGKVNRIGKLENPGIILLPSGIKNPTLRIKVKENNRLQEDTETKK
jgi:hypothetical protein